MSDEKGSNNLLASNHVFFVLNIFASREKKKWSFDGECWISSLEDVIIWMFNHINRNTNTIPKTQYSDIPIRNTLYLYSRRIFRQLPMISSLYFDILLIFGQDLIFLQDISINLKNIYITILYSNDIDVSWSNVTDEITCLWFEWLITSTHTHTHSHKNLHVMDPLFD